jgi:hypothetical protein
MDNVAILTVWTLDMPVGPLAMVAPKVVESGQVITVAVPSQGAIFEALGPTRLGTAARAGIGVLSRS